MHNPQNGESKQGQALAMALNTGILPMEGGKKLVFLNVSAVDRVAINVLLEPKHARELAQNLIDRAREIETGIVSGEGVKLPPPPGAKA